MARSKNLCVFLAAIGTWAHAALAAEPGERAEFKRKLGERGVSLAQYNTLKSAKLVGNSLEQPSESCGKGDRFTFNEKYMLSDRVVRATVTDIQYLYKKGGPFRTQYTLKVTESLKGGAEKEYKVLSEYGPNRMDHRRWKRDPLGVELEVGDQGIFFLSQNWVKKVSAKFPAREAALKGKYLFQNGMGGVYLLNGGEFDKEFLKASEKSQAGLKLDKAMGDVVAMKNLLGSEEK